MAILSLVLHCSALARNLNTFANNGIHDSTKSYLRGYDHTHVALLVDSVHDPDPQLKEDHYIAI